MGGPASKPMAAGFNLSSLVSSIWVIWETTIAVGLSVGLIVAFRELFRTRFRLLDTMAAASFAAYLFHPPIVIALQAAMATATLPAFAKFLIVSVLGTATAFTVTHLACKVPGIRAVLGPAPGSEPSLRSPMRQDSSENVPSWPFTTKTGRLSPSGSWYAVIQLRISGANDFSLPHSASVEWCARFRHIGLPQRG
jgi:peptidoglycan/LPS O-acetylase OafA/YrhL